MLRRILPAVGVVLGIVVATACGSDDAGDGSGNSSFGGSSSSGTLGGDAAVDDLLTGCATSTTKAELTPLDLYVMFDTSGSMATIASGTTTKIQAVRDAMKAFLEDPASAGIGVGMQFFPLVQKGVPDHCSANTDCPTGSGPCSMYKCDGSDLVWCDPAKNTGPGGKQNADCNAAGVGGSCVQALRCTDYSDAWCNGSNLGATCPNGWGTCQVQTDPKIGGFVCGYRFSCNPTDYEPPAAEIAPLPGAASTIENALAAKAVVGSTPTFGALEAATNHSVAYAKAHAGHTVVTVLATDGLPEWQKGSPTACDTNITNIAGIAGGALAGTPSVKTFVIGVFAAAQKAAAQTNLDAIAKAGGTSSAFIVEVGANTEKDFIAAMNQIRGAALPCDYELPTAQGGVPDYGRVNVRHTDPAGNKELFAYTKSSSACDPAQGGWYYDVDPSTGGTPTKLTLCPATCNEVKSSGGQVDVVLGCQTFIR